MSHIAIDFNKVNNKNYRVYRILQTSSVWADVYRKRIIELSSYKSAIIFPEMILGLNQNSVYCAIVRQGMLDQLPNVQVVLASAHIDSFSIYGIDHIDRPLRNLRQIEELELLSDDTTDRITFYCIRNRLIFAHYPLFSSKKDACKYGCRQLEALVGSHL